MDNTLLPPIPESIPVGPSKRSEAVYISDAMVNDPLQGWQRKLVYWFEGEDYEYVLAALGLNTEEDARRKLYSPAIDATVRQRFLEEVHLDMTRMH